ncbi:hypothetical protein HPB48_011913 [Haemaphysalis longicornis]|uniref:Uncharacterized protein n=1 Tax=Haemaphysalis longicornis TaxID=44386 RepID=A0A9J6GS82_HAELO|nr:hypothetical protein HPB48_011913 [Haemaphysalis longicornis]
MRENYSMSAQRAIPSPTLFNLSMSDFPPLLNAIAGLKTAIYTDDITLWCHNGSPGTQGETPQRGIDSISQYTTSIVLVCSHETKEYTVFINSRKDHVNDIG